LVGVWLSEVVERLVRAHRVVVFAHRGVDGGACVITARLAHLLVANAVDFSTVSVDDDELRSAVVAYSGWPSFPLVYLDGELVGGLNAVEELAAAGGLPCKEPPRPPLVVVRDGPRPANDVTPEPRVEIRMRPRMRLIVEGTVVSGAFPQVRILPRLEKLAPHAVRSMIDRGVPLVVVDVRPVAERSVARLRGAISVDRWRRMNVRDPARVVFYSNMEERALEVARGVTGPEVVYVMAGGLTAWLREVGTLGLVGGAEADEPPPSSPRGAHRDAMLFASGVRRMG
jgi:glutaredoxin-related protein